MSLSLCGFACQHVASMLIQRQHQGLVNDVYMLNITVMDLMCNIHIPAYTLNYFSCQNDFISRTGDFMFGVNLSGRSVYDLYLCGQLHGCGSSYT